ncbi:MAG: hypothetical protein A4E27_01061 [Methanobacterium sp. PtaU1.Bin242]|nr:MAG: hypothetical protein A4E27_01061 [Methanobacterium sp. PtaU1.Bin242]
MKRKTSDRIFYLQKITRNRIFLLLVLVILLVSLCAYYYENYEQHQEYPSLGTILVNYDEGQLVSVSGTVTGTFDGGFYLEDSYQDRFIKFKIISPTSVSVGDKASVLGVLGPDYQVTSTKLLVTPRWSYQFLLLRSFLAFFFLVFIFSRYWKFDRKNWLFIRRK